ncbi:general substrate transporter [Armillaria nabsnona]|nr:general substrate transporter [Armillaria nabsnona]
MGIISTSIAHQSFKDYMGNPNNAALGAIVSTFTAVQALGPIIQGFFGDILGRRRYMQLMCIVVIVGTVIQTAAQNYTVFLVGRILTGVAVGGLIGTVAIYNSEISPPATRGFICGLSGFMACFGTFCANWVGFACGYAPATASFQWRFPLSLQIPPGLILFVGLQFLLPESPRWLISTGRNDEALEAFIKIRGDISGVALQKEFEAMREQILFERTMKDKSFSKTWSKYKKRVIISVSLNTVTTLCGISIINYYQTTLYRQLGITGQTVLLLAGVFGSVGLVANLLSIYLLDKVGRVKFLKWGTVALCIDLIYCALMSRYFADSDNPVGKGFAVLGIYVFTAIFHLCLSSTCLLYTAEVLPVYLRNKIMGLAMSIHFILGIAIIEAGPSALANIRTNFYYVFVAVTFVSAIGISLYFPETKGKTLEEISASFGDKVVHDDDAMEVST